MSATPATPRRTSKPKDSAPADKPPKVDPPVSDGFEEDDQNGAGVDPAVVAAAAARLLTCEILKGQLSPVTTSKGNRHNLPHDYVEAIRKVHGTVKRTEDGTDYVVGYYTKSTGDPGVKRVGFRWKVPTAKQREALGL